MSHASRFLLIHTSCILLISLPSWKRIAELSINWSLKIYSEKWIEELQDFERKIRKLSISDVPKANQKNILMIVQKHGSQIQELSITSLTLDDCSTFTQILKAMPKLKKVFMERVAVRLVDFNLNEINKMINLKALEMIRCSYEMCGYFLKSQLTTLAIKRSIIINPHGNIEPLLDFMASQRDLTSLALESFNCGSKFFEAAIQDKKFPFKLRKLCLVDVDEYYDPHEDEEDDEPVDDNRSLMQFMKKHSETIEELELREKFSSEIYELVFAKFEKLKTLRLLANDIPTEKSFFKRLRKNRSIVNLTLIGSRPPDQIFAKVPNVETFKWLPRSVSSESKTLKIVSESLKLKNLIVGGIVLKNVNFPNLISLRLLLGCDGSKLQEFAKSNPNITELYVAETFANESLDITKIVKHLKHLQVLTIGEDRSDKNDHKMDKPFFNFLRENCKELKSFNLHESNFQADISEVADVPGLCLRKSSYFAEPLAEKFFSHSEDSDSDDSYEEGFFHYDAFEYGYYGYDHGGYL